MSRGGTVMKLICGITVVLIWATLAYAETYSWVDDNGTYNFSEDYSRVPKKYRNKVDKRGDFSAVPVSKESDTPPAGVKTVPPASAQNVSSGQSGVPAGSFDGKSYDQWKQEFSEREAAMSVIKKRVDEIDDLLKKRTLDKEQSQGLVSERSKAIEQYTAKRKEYDQLVERARNAGVKVMITR
jgi:hypothetical protein